LKQVARSNLRRSLPRSRGKAACLRSPVSSDIPTSSSAPRLSCFQTRPRNTWFFRAEPSGRPAALLSPCPCPKQIPKIGQNGMLLHIFPANITGHYRQYGNGRAMCVL